MMFWGGRKRLGGVAIGVTLLTCGVWHVLRSPEVPFNGAVPPRESLRANLSCGPAALLTVASTRGPNVASRLRTVLERDGLTTRPVTNLYDLASCAKRIGLDPIGLKVEPQQLGQVPLPAIVHVKPGHFLPLLAVDDDQVLVVKQGGVTHAIPRRDFDRRFTGYVLCLRGPPTEPPESS